MEQFQTRIQELIARIQNRAVALWERIDGSKQKKKLVLYYKVGREWTRIHVRRWTHLFHGAAAGNRAVGPISFLLVSAALGTALTLTTLYSTSYAVVVDGQQVGVVADQSVVDHAIETVESQGSQLLGYDYQISSEVNYEFALTLKSDLSDEQTIQNYFYEQLNEVSDELRAYEVVVDGRSIGVVKDQNALNQMLEELKQQYTTENTVQVEFAENLQINSVYAVDDYMTTDEMRQALEANTTGDTTYTVQKGDTFNAIAYANDMSISDLKALNPGVDINRLMVGADPHFVRQNNGPRGLHTGHRVPCGNCGRQLHV